jgi:hydrogenase expression/formation protein HypE
LQIISSGTPVVTVSPERAEGVSKTLEESGTHFSFVGQVRDGVGVRMLKDSVTVHHTKIRCEEDELARMWALHPREG